MSGLEILGVAASTVQLAQLSLAIVTTWSSLFFDSTILPTQFRIVSCR
jgi:hypothetical protein